MFRRLLAAWGHSHGLPARPARRGLRLEHLEGREVPTVALADIPDQQITNNAPIYLPVTVTNTPSGSVTYQATTDNPAVSAQVVGLTRSVRFTVTGQNPDGTTFTGDIVIRLFENEAPATTQRLIDLVNSGYYTSPTLNPDGSVRFPNKVFHRIANLDGNFPNETIAQAGSANGSGSGHSPLPGNLPDEFSPDLRFNSPGVVASANSGDDTTDSQFFIVRPGISLAERPQFLNFNYTVFGIVTAGADLYERINAAPRTGSTPNSPVLITGATVFTDPSNAVLRVTTQANFTGSTRLTVTPSDNSGASPAETATLTAVASDPTQGNRPFLGAGIATNLTTTAGTPITFSVPFTDVDGSPVTFDVRADSTDANGNTLPFSVAPADATVSVNQAARTVTLTPRAGFTGTVSLRVGVRDDVNRAASLNDASNFDTQALTLTVTPATATPAATVGLTANPASVPAGQPTTLTATVTVPGVTSPAGTVEFRSGSALLATAPVSNGTATTVQTFAAPGTQFVRATFVPADSTVVTTGTSPDVTVAVTDPTTTTPTGPAATTTVLAVNPAAPRAGDSVTLTATVQGAGTAVAAGTVQFFNNGALLATAPVLTDAGGGRTATVSTTTLPVGSQTLSAVFVPADATAQQSSTSQSVPVKVTAADAGGGDTGGGNTGGGNTGGGTTTPPAAGTTAQGARAGEAPRVRVFNSDGTERLSFLAFEEGFTGGVRTAVADVTGDGIPDIVVVPAFGGSPLIKVFSSTVAGQLLASKMVFEESFRGGLTLAVGDTGALGYQRVLVGAGEGGAPRVTLYDFRTDSTVLNYFAYDSTLRGGVSVAMGALPGGTGADIVTGSGAGGGPLVNVYDGDTGTLLGNQLSGDPSRRDGIGVRVGPNPDNTGTVIFVRKTTGDGSTADDPLDLGFVNFAAADQAAQQKRIQGLVSGSGSGTTATGTATSTGTTA